MKEYVGKTLGRYKIVSQLGEGGMGAVFQGEDPTLQRAVAVKVMHRHLVRRPGFAERFLQEARSAARLDHPGIVKVYEFDQKSDVLFIAMEFIPGENLRQMLHDMRSNGKWVMLQDAVEITRQVALALDYAHRQGVLHRDIKPDNIMLKTEPSEALGFRPVITDLGLAKLREGGVQTDHGMSLGTPAYMSPEQALGQAVDARSDVYSLGVLLYELTVGRLPFSVKTISEAIGAHTQPPPPPRSLRPDLPTALEKIILQALAKSSAERYPSAAALAQALSEAADVTTIDTAPPTLVATSLATELQHSQLKPRGASLMVGLPTPTGSGQDRIVLRGPHSTERMVAIEGRELVVGRSSNADVVLDDSKASRQHAKIIFDGVAYQVYDLNSTNGTLLANAKLLPGIGQEWTPDKPLRIGDHWLFLQHGGQAATGVLTRSDGTLVGASQQRTSANQQIAVFIEPTRLAVEAGGSVVATLNVLNQGAVVDHYLITVSGVPTTWLPTELPVMQLMPGAQKTVNIALQPPRTPESRGGDYPLRVRVASQQDPTQAAEVQLALVVAPYRQYQVQLKPERLRAGAAGQVVVQNQGNSDETYAITWEDSGDELVFQPRQAQLAVPAGQAGAVTFGGRPHKRPWFGGQKLHSFAARVTPPQGPPQSPQGMVVSSGRLPPWLPPLFIFLCLVLSAAAAFAVNQQQSSVQRTTATADARLLAQSQAATAQARETISQATLEHQSALATSVAATAEWKEILNAANQATRDAVQFTQATERAVEQTRQSEQVRQTEDARQVALAATQTAEARQAALAPTQTAEARQAALAPTQTAEARQVALSATQTAEARQPVVELPVAIISGPAQAFAGTAVTFDGSSSTPIGGINRYIWNFGGVDIVSGATVDYTFGQAGAYDVILVVTNSNGQSDQATQVVQVGAPQPTAPPSVPLEGTVWTLQGTLPGTLITATFDQGAISGSGGCNTYSGSYLISGRSISIGALTVTSIFCSPEVMNQETAYLSSLQTVDEYEFEGNQLRLSGRTGDNIRLLVYAQP